MNSVEISPASVNEHLEFENREIYGFTMSSYPTIDGIITKEFNVNDIMYCSLDATTQSITSKQIWLIIECKTLEIQAETFSEVRCS
jgi:hypothetical protein